MLLPTLNLPEKSVVTSQAVQRREVKKIVIPEVKLKEKHSYKDFEDFFKKVQRLKLGDWKVTSSISKCILTLDDEKYNIPKFEIYVDISLEFTVRSYGWCLPDNHQIYKQNKRSLRFSTVSSLVLSLNLYVICSGISDGTNLPQLSIHSIPLKLSVESDHPNQSDQTYRSNHCNFLILKNLHSSCFLFTLDKINFN